MQSKNKYTPLQTKLKKHFPQLGKTLIHYSWGFAKVYIVHSFIYEASHLLGKTLIPIYKAFQGFPFGIPLLMGFRKI